MPSTTLQSMRKITTSLLSMRRDVIPAWRETSLSLLCASLGVTGACSFLVLSGGESSQFWILTFFFVRLFRVCNSSEQETEYLCQVCTHFRLLSLSYDKLLVCCVQNSRVWECFVWEQRKPNSRTARHLRQRGNCTTCLSYKTRWVITVTYNQAIFLGRL
jgi:hypothetical protein